MKRSQGGSLLLEVALVTAVVGVLAVVSFSVLSATRKSQDQAVAGNSLMITEQAIRTFMLREKRLPCPDLAGNGFEAKDAVGQCPAGLTTGYVPFESLQLEKPPVNGSIRYGVWRGPTADLTRPSAATSSPSYRGLEGQSLLLYALVDALKATLDTDKPYIAQLNALNEHTNCAAPSDNPAFLLAVDAPTQRESPSRCFADDPATGNKVLAVSRQELLGWARARLPG